MTTLEPTAAPRERLSVIVIARNEAARLPTCLRSVAFADEIVVVDSGSSDGTPDLARSLGASSRPSTGRASGPQKQRARRRDRRLGAQPRRRRVGRRRAFRSDPGRRAGRPPGGHTGQRRRTCNGSTACRRSAASGCAPAAGSRIACRDCSAAAARASRTTSCTNGCCSSAAATRPRMRRCCPACCCTTASPACTTASRR